MTRRARERLANPALHVLYEIAIVLWLETVNRHEFPSIVC